MYTVTITNGTEKTTIHSDNLDRISGGKVVKAVNAVVSFTFIIYPDNAGYNKLKPLTTSVTGTDDSTGKDIFIGRVLKCPDSMNEQGLICKSVTCEGRLGWLYDSIQPYVEYKMVGIRTVLASFISKHNAQVGDDKHISVGQVTVTGENNYTYSVNWVSTMDAISEQLVGKFGGEIQLRDQDGKVYIDYLEHIGHGTDTKIELAVNLKTISREVDETSVITRLYPLGAKQTDSEKRLTIGTVNGGKDYIEDSALVAKYGVISGTQTWDDVTQASVLKTKATAYLKSANKAKKQYKITAVDLSTIDMNFEQFELGCWYRVVNPLMGIDEDLRIIGITINLDNPEQSELTFGDKFETMTGFMTAKTKSLQTAIDDSEFRNRQVIDSKIENATKLITGAEGGHVILDPSEKPQRILIMDTADINTCKSCIQLNYKGLGFWTPELAKKAGQADGGSAKDGPYTNAWTIDGNLVASFITALTLTGLKINNGSGTFSVSEDGTVVANRLSSKSADITGGTINLQTSSETTSAIQLSHNEWTVRISPLEIRIDNASISGHVVIQAGAVFGYNGERQTFTLSTEDGSLTLLDENSKPAIFCLGKTGEIYCKSISTENHTLD